jgi:hypothetical protein
VRLSIQSLSTGGTLYWKEIHSSITTNNIGLFTLVLGTGTRQTDSKALTFKEVDWKVTQIFLKTEIFYDGVWKDMGTTPLWSVPYAMVADSAAGLTTGAKISVRSDNDGALNEALFEVKRKDGQTVFAVYPEAVNIYVPRSSKSTKGGFAVGGFETTKQGPQDYFRVTPDSVRIYIDPTPDAKSTKGGFAVGGYETTKGINNMYFNLTGASNVNTVKGSPQILWYPNKNAFLAGNVHIGAIDSVGRYSTALGYRSIAMGDYSQAFGYMAKAFGDYSTSIGRNSVAGVRDKAGSIAGSAFALGNSTRATGEDSYAFGSGAVAEGEKSFALGSVALDESGNPLKTEPTRASGPYSTAIGMGAQATQKGAMALGVRASSSGYYSNSFGYLSVSSGYYSTAIGYHAAATNYYAGSYGYYSKADGQGSVALGNKSWAISDYSVAIGDSAKTTAAYAGAFGRMAKAKGSSSVAIGYNAVTYGTDAGAFGKNSLAKGVSSVAIGNGASTGADATDASALGKSASATGSSSMALGISASSVGSNSMAIGNTSVANAPNSTSLGSNTSTAAAALYSTALGFGSTTSGQYATALGYNSQANGSKSISIGAYYDYWYLRPTFYIDPITHRIIIRYISTHITKNNIANDDYSVAIGNGNESSHGGFTFGSNNYARSTGAVALGHSNSADSSYSLAAGYANSATGIGAFAMGENITAQSFHSFVVGSMNIIEGTKDEWIDTDPLFVVGNGTSSRSNAFTIAKNGTMNVTSSGRFGGDITLSSASPAFYFTDTDLDHDDFKFEANSDALVISTQGKTPVNVLGMSSTGAVAMPNIGTGTGTTLVWNSTLGQILRSSSSMKYKTDINTLTDYSWLYDLTPVDFLYKSDTEKQRQYGLIAEDVVKVNKDLVFYKDGEPDAVNYNSLVAPLLKAVQDQKKTIESLQADNDDLKQRLEKLESIVETLTQAKK